jgi:energy-coupling factor transporter ATP-binding protein EcfA2
MERYITQYQSANLNDEQVIGNFVVRTKEFERLMADIRTTDRNGSFQHYVFVGRRGSGKSTLLRRIQAAIHTDKDLKERFIATNLSEEQAGINKLYDLWDYVMRDLKAKGFSLPEIDWQDYQDDLKEYSKTLFGAIHDLLQKENKQLVLLVDNIDRIFKNIGKEANLLREQLMNYNDVRIIGGSTIMSEDFWRYDMPFYQFFSIKRLEPLSLEEIAMLLKHWAEVKGNPEIAKFVEHHPGKIQAVRMLTDGTPRTMQLFVDMIIDRPNEQGFDYLRRLIDYATPVYQERLGQLSPQQQKIVVELSFFGEAASIEQLVPMCKMTGKNISAQMSQLIKARIVEKIKGETKNMYYRLEERFFNLWLLMTQGGSSGKRQLLAWANFIEDWYQIEKNPFIGLGVRKSVEADPYSYHDTAETKDDYAMSANEPETFYGFNDPFDDEVEAKRLESHWVAWGYYYRNRKHTLISKQIKIALRRYPHNLSVLAINSIISLWSGDMVDYIRENDNIVNRMVAENSDFLSRYFVELMVHYQFSYLAEKFGEPVIGSKLKSLLMPIYYAWLELKAPDSPELQRMPPEIAENVADIVRVVKDRQALYY